MFGREVHFKAVSHIEYLVHFAPVRITLFFDSLEQRRNREKVIFDDAAVVAYKMQNFGLCAAGAVHHAMNFGTEGIEQLFHYRRIRAGRREHQLAGIQRTAFDAVSKFHFSAVYQLVGYGFVIAFRIFLGEVFGENIVAGAGKSVATHTTVIFFLISGLPAG